jgi:hypothetical protein
MSHYGFILTRHVNSEVTNKYWNQNVKLIRTFYPFRKIVIIDDNSNQDFIKADFDYKNLTVIQSEYPGRGELLPYIYLLKYKWFPNAVIIHDSVFLHTHVPFETFKFPVLPLWCHDYDKENLPNLIRITSYLRNNRLLFNKLNGDNTNLSTLGTNENNKFFLCFGSQSYIKLPFLELLEEKYQISNLVHAIHNRTDRCALERIIGLLFTEEYPRLKKLKALFGSIFKHPEAFTYTYEKYNNNLKRKKIPNIFVKCWTGR